MYTYLSLEPGSAVDLVQLVQQGRDGTGKAALVGQALLAEKVTQPGYLYPPEPC
jgi:hypothetical protein